ncbi:hypothetical protein ACFO0N_18280 [Halobium salinum]|uniref:DUF7508 domain-containing protein n=1 Tax=Halobium salinum TaxID=1364940 RepID=A0ABD5PGN5_9EURY|nr:hypothetical protein [Halobium salinum]
MALRKAWRTLDASTVGSAPERYGYYELGDGSGERIGRGVGVLRDELKEVMAYGDAAQVRWEAATSREHAERIAESHE